jgi:thiol-disulfide isomerase/thioredoxin
MRLTRDIPALLLAAFLSVSIFAHAAQGEPAHLQTPLLNGGAFDLKKQRGKVVVVNFWATWCPVCRAEFPTWQKVYEDYQDRDFEMIAVSIDRKKRDLDKFMKKSSYTVPIAWRFDELEDDGFPKIRSTPTTYFIDRDGNVVKEQLGPMGDQELRKTLDGLLQP